MIVGDGFYFSNLSDCFKKFGAPGHDVPFTLYEDSRGVLEQLLQAARGTVGLQIAVDVVDVLNSRGEMGSLGLVCRRSLLVVFFWYDAPFLQVMNQILY